MVRQACPQLDMPAHALQGHRSARTSRARLARAPPCALLRRSVDGGEPPGAPGPRANDTRLSALPEHRLVAPSGAGAAAAGVPSCAAAPSMLPQGDACLACARPSAAGAEAALPRARRGQGKRGPSNAPAGAAVLEAARLASACSAPSRAAASAGEAAPTTCASLERCTAEMRRWRAVSKSSRAWPGCAAAAARCEGEARYTTSPSSPSAARHAVSPAQASPCRQLGQSRPVGQGLLTPGRSREWPHRLRRVLRGAAVLGRCLAQQLGPLRTIFCWPMSGRRTTCRTQQASIRELGAWPNKHSAQSVHSRAR